MADFSHPPGGTVTLKNPLAIPAVGNASRSVRFARAPRSFTVYCKGETTDITWDVYAVTPFGDIQLGSQITASTSLKKTTFSTDIAQEIKVRSSNAHATLARNSFVAVVSNP